MSQKIKVECTQHGNKEITKQDIKVYAVGEREGPDHQWYEFRCPGHARDTQASNKEEHFVACETNIYTRRLLTNAGVELVPIQQPREQIDARYFGIELPEDYIPNALIELYRSDTFIPDL